MAAMQVDRDIPGFLAKQKASAPAALKEAFATFLDLYERKLWHQLTVALQQFVTIKEAEPFILPLYEHFIVDWEGKMNQLALVQYAARAAKTYKDPAKALALLTARAAKLKEKGDAKEAHILATAEAAHYKLVTSDLVGTKAAIDECEKALEGMAGIEPTIHAAVYRVAADYYKAKAAYPQYYHNALLFLSSVNVDELSKEEKVTRAHDLALSALLGEGLYNFGELLMHPILDSLKQTPHEWLRQLLFTFNNGNMASFETITHTADFLTQKLLSGSTAFLRQKMCLMSLVEGIFKRSKEQRGRIPFAEIANETKVAPEDVEHLIMKALSLGLLKGSIDELDKVVQISWVQPRVLDKGQLQTLIFRLDDWAKKVQNQTKSLEGQEGARELFLQ